MLDSTIQLGNQTVPLIFGNATPINRLANNASHTYLKILDFFKRHKHHYIESVRVTLNNFRFLTDVEKDIFTLKDLISNLEKAQGSLLVDSNKFGVLRESMRVEKRVKINMAFDHACLTNQSFNETLD